MKSGSIEQTALKKSPHKERLINILHQMAPVVTNRLFSDTEAGEDGGEDIWGGDGAGDGAEVVENFPKVGTYHV